MAVGGIAVKGVIRALEMTVFIIGMCGACQGIEVQAADKAHTLGNE